jgi:threonylcarbamoyladenosine tRNA methylthiotransferase CDKAL1
MEDIEDVLGPAGLSGGGAPPGLRLPLAAVAVKPKRRSSRVAQAPPQPEARIPGTQVTPSLAGFLDNIPSVLV